jgi:hypothetical protein
MSGGDRPLAIAASRAAMQSETSFVPMLPGSDWMLLSPKPVEPLKNRHDLESM